MDFDKWADADGEIRHPYAGKKDGHWVIGTISKAYLSDNFGHCKTLDECIANTESEGLKLFFEHLKPQQ